MSHWIKIVQIPFSIEREEDIYEYIADVRVFCVYTKYGEDADGNRGIWITEIEDFEILSIKTVSDQRKLESCIYYSFEEIIADKLKSIDLSDDEDDFNEDMGE